MAATRRASGPSAHKDKTSGTWYFKFDSIHTRHDGSRRQIKRGGFPTASAANAALREALRVDRALRSRGNPTVGELFDALIERKKLQRRAPSTVAQYIWAGNIARTRWPAIPAEQITYEMLDQTYLEMLTSRAPRQGEGTHRPYSDRSAEIFHKAIKAAFALAVSRGVLLRNPADLATKPAVSEALRRWWTPRQVGEFLAYTGHLDASGSNPLPRALIEVLADTGARRGETLAVRWGDLDLDAATLAITRQYTVDGMRPTKRPRSKSVISLDQSTVAALRARRVQQAEDRLRMGRDWPDTASEHHDLVFTWLDGRAIEPGYLTRVIADLSVAAGLPRLTTHGLRHSFASAALAAGVPVEVVAHRLGNTVRVVQEVYAHVIPTDDAAASAQVAALFRQAATEAAHHSR